MPSGPSLARSRGRCEALRTIAGLASSSSHRRFHFGNRASHFLLWVLHTSLDVNLLKVPSPARDILLSMQQTDVIPESTSERSPSIGWANLPSSAPASFAGLLASLTAPVPKTAWNNDDLAEDVATLSYEHALRAHARYSSDEGNWKFPPASGSTSDQAKDLLESESADSAQNSALWAAPGWGKDARVDAADSFSTVIEQNKKCASITIRLSKTECDQLRRRASQAGLTVSAYLRSCTFEAEALRAQVKDVLAELRAATASSEPGASPTSRRAWFKWLLRFVPRRRSSQRVAQA